jgi:hypothetical protein
LDGLDARHCGEFAGTQRLAPAVEALKLVARQVVLYEPPISARMRQTLPECYTRAYQETLEHFRQDPRIIVLNGNPASYGLTDGDYLYSSEKEGIAQFDSNHVNFWGARKVSQAISNVLARSAP